MASEHQLQYDDGEWSRIVEVDETPGTSVEPPACPVDGLTGSVSPGTTPVQLSGAQSGADVAVDAVEQLRAENDDLRARWVEARADRDAAEARYTALVEGVREFIDALDFVDVMVARPDPFMTFTPQSVQDRLRALLPTTEEG